MQVKSVLDTPIYHKTYELYRLLYTYSGRMSKTHRHTVWQKCEQTNLDMLQAIIHTAHTQGAMRFQAVCSVSEKLDFLKTMTRLAREVNAIDQPTYVVLQGFLQEIGRMVGGWIKAS